MKIIAVSGSDEVARVYLADLGAGRLVEFVESVQPPLPREEKWVLLVSTLLGCPVGCPMCDAGGDYRGRLSADEILRQLDFLVRRRYPDGHIPAAKFKVQFARLGEPAFNPAVLDVLRGLPGRYDAPGLLPSVSTVAPRRSDGFFEELVFVKEELYAGGRFQLQFSIHTTDPALRERLVPVEKWGFAEIARYAERFLR
ncbi:MAG TPA: radical SAM protein, partial [Candidatus Coatesbacteria bacterium]|nr:radical SAM protein [Candidatus Coatesbacteria bacterium]